MPNNNIAAAIPSNDCFKLSTFKPSLPIAIDESDILLTAKANPINTAERAAITPTAFHNLAGSIKLSAIIEAANIAIDIAIFLRALALILNAIDPKTLPKFFKILPIPFADFLKTTPTPANISPKPPTPSAKFPKASANFLATIRRPTLIAPENIEPQLIFLKNSITPENFSSKAAPISGNILVIPIIKPAIINPPIAIITFDGDAMPRIFFIVLIIRLPISISFAGKEEIPSLSPFLRPSIMFLPTSFKSMFLIFSKNC